MEIEHSEFITNSRSVLEEYLSRLGKEFEYVSILASDVSGKRYAVTTTGTSIKDSSWSECGAVIRVFDGNTYSEFSFNELGKEYVEENLSRIRKTVEFKKKIGSLGLKTVNYKAVEEDEMNGDYRGYVEILPESVDSSEKIARLEKIVERAHAISTNLVMVATVYEEVKITKLFLSGKKDLIQSYIWSQGYIDAVVKDPEDSENTKEAFDSFSGLKGPELIAEIENSLEKTISNAEMLLTAERIEPGEYDVICSPAVAGLIAHEAFGHGVEMDMFVKKRAKAEEYMGEYVASPITSMHDGAAAAREVSSYWFDDEGVPANDTVVIENGILKAGISDQLTAMQLGINSTGNGKRESYERKIYTRMTNTFFSPGKDNLEDMISSTKHGYLLENYDSGMEDPKNWGIQCIVSFGKEIKDGRLTGKVVSPVMMTGYVPDLLKSISMVSQEVELSGSGGCGKGYKEFVKVSCGGPYIKAKARLG